MIARSISLFVDIELLTAVESTGLVRQDYICHRLFRESRGRFGAVTP